MVHGKGVKFQPAVCRDSDESRVWSVVSLTLRISFVMLSTMPAHFSLLTAKNGENFLVVIAWLHGQHSAASACRCCPASSFFSIQLKSALTGAVKVRNKGESVYFYFGPLKPKSHHTIWTSDNLRQYATIHVLILNFLGVRTSWRNSWSGSKCNLVFF